jgi:putative hydrolase of the HAD superfamily
MIKQKIKPDFDVILFDLGGVLVELGEHAIPTSWLGGKTLNSQDWFHSPIALQFEKGQISSDEFASALIKKFRLNVSRNEVITAFTAWPKGVFPEVPKLLSELQKDYKLAVLSNSNECHWPRILDEFKFGQTIDTLFSSHLINLAKPDPLAFKHVLGSLDIKASKVLFFDDNLANINIANSLGIESIHVNDAKGVVDYFAL